MTYFPQAVKMRIMPIDDIFERDLQFLRDLYTFLEIHKKTPDDMFDLLAKQMLILAKQSNNGLVESVYKEAASNLRKAAFAFHTAQK